MQASKVTRLRGTQKSPHDNLKTERKNKTKTLTNVKEVCGPTIRNTCMYVSTTSNGRKHEEEYRLARIVGLLLSSGSR